jgi:DNA replication and repair protein RecF
MLTDIRLQNFRSYKDSAFELDKGINIIVGPNASGKTNLLEAILIISKGSSYRAKATEQILFKKPWARLEAHTSGGGLRTVKLQLINDTKAVKTFEIDNKPYKRLPLNQTLPTVLFEPQHLLLLSAGPELRRDYLDDLLEQTQVGYNKIRSSYKRALYQRNTLLKRSIGKSDQQLFAWNVRVSELGAQLAKPRYELSQKLNQQITQLYNQLSGSKTKIELNYLSSLNIETYGSSLLKKLETDVELDLLRGYTAHGPHRDDLDVKINGHKAQDIASRGEIRTILLALKILELRTLEEIREIKPLLLLDDVFSELDGARRRSLTEFLSDYQTFITTTDADLVIHNFAQKCNIISLSR